MEIYKISVIRHSIDWKICDRQTIAYCTKETVEKVKQAYKEMYQVDNYWDTSGTNKNKDIILYVDTINVVTE